MTENHLPTLSCVILTRGDRPEELARAIQSVQVQYGDSIEIVLVANGVPDLEAPPGLRVVRTDENVGIPRGRNEGTRHSTGDVVIYLDDDGWLPDCGFAEQLRRAFAKDPQIGVVSFRIEDPDTGLTERRHVPRLRVGDPRRSSWVTTFLGGACAIRRSIFDECGPYPEQFFYCHEETDFAWRVLDAGYRIRYDAGLLMYHPGGPPGDRHKVFYYLNARNRVWLAKRRLPWPVAATYIGVWLTATLIRSRRFTTLGSSLRGFGSGFATAAGSRAPMSWRTAILMTWLGRPPVV